MKLLLLYTYNSGYLSKFFLELSVKLKNEGYDVVNYCLKYKEDSISEQNIPIFIKKKGGYLSNYFEIYKSIKAQKPDVVISNFSYVNPSLLFGRLLGVKKNIAWFHSLNNQMTPSKSNVFVKKQFLKMADVLVANSYLTEKELYEIYDIPRHKLKVLPFWTNIADKGLELSGSKFVKNRNILNIGCPGRLTAHKNQMIVIEALSRLKEVSRPNCQLYFAGTGEDHSKLSMTAEEINMNQEITFLGHLSADDMLVFYKEMDVIILPSLDEAFGLVFIEAISLGVPVIVSSRFGALTFIDDSKFDIEDFTFNPKSSVDLALKLNPYFQGLNKNSSYFIDLYQQTFNKEKVYQLIKTVLISTT